MVVKIHNEDTHSSCSSLYIITKIELRRIGLAIYLAQIGEKRNPCRISVGKAGNNIAMNLMYARVVYTELMGTSGGLLYIW
jgi:hypothetical protein